MEEVVKALSPFPVVQGIVIGLLVAAVGFWAIRKGLQDSRRDDARDDVRIVRVDHVVAVRVEHTDEEKRWQWEAYKQLGHLENNSFAEVKHAEDSVELLREVLKSINRLADTHFNARQ